MSELTIIKAPIKDEILKFDNYFKASIKSKIQLLDIITNFIIRKKRKQLRSMLVFLSAKLSGGITESTYIAASLIELLHTATLIHDDVVDEAYEKRSFLSINALWKSKIAVLMGDYLLAKGLLLAVNNKSHSLLEIVSDAVKEMSEGELLQIQRSRTLNMTQEEYFEVIRKKTATLISACSAVGATSAAADKVIVEKMKSFGLNFGMAIQMKDDLLDYKHKGFFGKPSSIDLKEKKFTLPLIYSLENSSSVDKNKIICMINQSKKSINLSFILNFVHKKGGLVFTEKTMIIFKNKALEDLSFLPESKTKEALVKLVNYSIQSN